MAAVAHLRPSYAGYVRGRIVDASILSVAGVPIATIAKTGSASDVTTGVLPPAQVPGLDASKIITGTMSLARLPLSSSNIFTGYNQASVTGSGALPFGAGAFVSSNRDGTYKTLFANNKGIGAGGWEWVSYNADSSFDRIAASLTSAGGLSLASLTASTTTLGADGSITAGGVVTVAQGSAAGGSQILLQQTGTPSCTHRIASRHYASTLAGNAVDTYLWTWGVDGSNPGSQLALSVTQAGIGINNVPNPQFGVDCNGSANILGVIKGLGVGGLLMRVFDESNASFPSSGAIPELFKGRPIDAQLISTINYAQNNAGVAITPGYTQNYSVRISGYLKPPSSDTYTFSVFVDDGVRMWINNTKIMDAWQIQATTLNSTSLALGTAWVPFRIEYCQAAYGSGLQVSWRGAGNNTSYTPLSHSATGFQMAYDNIERPPTSMGTTWFNGKALFTENCGFGGQTTPTYPVDATGGMRSSGDVLFNTFTAGTLGNTSAAAFAYTGLATTGYAALQTSTGATSINSIGGQGITFRDSNAIGMTYSQSALRIGDTALPTATLDVAGGVKVAVGALGLVAGTVSGTVSSMAAMASGSQLEVGVAGAAGDLSSSAVAGDCVIRAKPVSTAGQKRLMIQCGTGVPSITLSSTGSVGINTSTPLTTLDVAGSTHVSSSLQADSVVYLNNQASSCMLALSSTTSGIPASNSTSFYGLGMLPNVGLRYQVAVNASDSHVFMGGTTEIMRITNANSGTTVSGPFNVSGLSTLATAQVTGALGFAGTNTRISTSSSGDSVSITGGGGSKGLAVDYNSRVGIGTLSPGFPLDVVGAARIQSTGAPAAVYSYANGQSSSYWSAGSDANNNYAISNQNSVGTYLVNGQTSWTSTSDARAKTDIRTIHTGLEKVMQMNPVSFKWAHSQQPGYGVIAQEMQQMLPEVVDVAGDRMGVRYQELVPFLIEAVQTLHSQHLQLMERMKTVLNLD